MNWKNVIHQYNIYEKYGNNRYGNQSVGKSGSVSFKIVEGLEDADLLNPYAEIDPETGEKYAYIQPPNRLQIQVLLIMIMKHITSN